MTDIEQFMENYQIIEQEVFGMPALKTYKMPFSIIENSLSIPDYLGQFLTATFSDTLASNAIQDYYLGGHHKWPGASVFWQVDFTGSPRAGKIMLYDPSNGKRRKDGRFFTWYHKEHFNLSYELKQCFFGEHLLSKYENKPVAIVESEKTALICAIVFPSFVWLASGGMVNINSAKCRVLMGREVHLFPDENGAKVWGNYIIEFPELYRATLNTFEGMEKGEDIADLALKIFNNLNP